MKSPSTPGAILNVKEAMVLVERAQNDLDRAAQKLSSIRYGSDLMDKTFDLRTAVNNLWYRLDSEPDPTTRAERRVADRIDGYDRDDLGLSEDR